MWPFKKRLPPLEHIPDVVNGECPWRLMRYKDCKNLIGLEVYRFGAAEWTHLDDCAETILGMKRSEYLRVMKERYNARWWKPEYGNVLALFDREEDARKALEALTPCYEDYYLPKAMAARLLEYSEGGFAPYFKK